MNNRESTDRALARNGPTAPIAARGGESAVQHFLPDMEFVVRAGHSNAVEALAFSPGGTTLATGSHDATIKLWNLRNGALLRTLEMHYAKVTALTFARGGRILAACSRDWSISLWDTETGAFLLSVPQEGVPESVVFDAAGDFFASCSYGLLTVWNARTGSRLRSEKFEKYRTCSIAADARANLLAVACRGQIDVQDFHTGRRRQRLRIANEGVKFLAFSGDGNRLAAAFSDGTVRIWLTSGWIQAAEMKIDERCKVLAVDPLCGRVAGANSEEILQWEVETSRLVARWETEDVSALSFSDDGRLLADGSPEGSTRVWSPEGELRLWLDGYENSVKSLSLDPAGSLVAVMSTSAVTVWDLQRGALRYTMRSPGEHVRQVELHGQGGSVTVLSSSELAIHDSATGRSLRTLWRGNEVVGQFAVNPQGTLIAAKIDETQVSLWDSRGLLVRNLSAEDSRGGNVAFDRTGELLAVGGYNDCIVSVWEVKTGRKLWQFKGSFPVAFHPSSSWLAVGSSGPSGGTATVYDLRTGKFIQRLGMQDNPGSFTEDPTGLYVSPSGRFLAASYFWGQAHMWEVVTGKHVGNLEKWTMDIAFHPVDDILAASHSENCFTLWNTSLQQVGSFRGTGARCADAMCFDWTGKVMLTGLSDGRVMVWPIARQQWVITFLPVSPYHWITYTRDGYFIGSDDVEGAVSMYFGRGERSYAVNALRHPRDNPNPEKVAAALALAQAQSKAETTTRPASSAVQVERPNLLGAPEP